MKKRKKLPIVRIEAADHFIGPLSDVSGDRVWFDTVGVLIDETPSEWLIATMIFDKNIHDDNNEGIRVIKTPGSKMKIVGYIS